MENFPPYLLTIINILVAVFSAHFVLLKNPGKPINKVYYIFALLYAYWEFTIFMMNTATSQQEAYFWARMDFIWPLQSALIMHFVLLLIEHKKFLQSKLTYLIIYGVPALLAFANVVFADFFYGMPYFSEIKDKWEYGQISMEAYYLPVIIQFLLLALCIGFAFNKLKQILNANKRKQIKIILAGLILPFLLSMLYEVTALMGIILPDIPLTSMMVITLFFGYAIFRYGVFGLDYYSAMEVIADTMSDALIVTDTELMIKNVNPAVASLFKVKSDQILDKNLAILFPNAETEAKLKEQVMALNNTTDLELTIVDMENKEIPVSFSISKVFDKRSELAGFTFLLRDITNRKKLEDKLQDEIAKLSEMNEVFVGRELKMVELKNELEAVKTSAN